MFRSRAINQIEAHMSWQFTKIENWLNSEMSRISSIGDLFGLAIEPELERDDETTVGHLYTALDKRLVEFGVEMNEIGADTADLVIGGKTACQMVLCALWEASPYIKTTKQIGDMMPIVEAMVDELKVIATFKDDKGEKLEQEFIEDFKAIARMRYAQTAKVDGFDSCRAELAASKAYRKAEQFYLSLPCEFRRVMEFTHCSVVGARCAKAMLERQDKQSIDTMANKSDNNNL